MKNELAIKVAAVLQNFFRQQKDETKLYFRGEEAILIFINEVLKYGTVTPTDISENLGITTARVAASLNSLQSKGLITREINCEDRRKIIISLTEKGSEKVQVLIENHLTKLNNLLTKIGKNDTEELLRIIQKITNIMQEENGCA